MLESHDAFGRELTPDDARRRAQPVTLGRYEDDRERWRIAGRRWRRRAALTFVALAVVSTISGFLSYKAGRDSSSGLRLNARAAVQAQCVSGGDLRIVIAHGLDSLRRLAIVGAPPTAILPFVRHTQPPIDELLTQAAFGRGSRRAYHTPGPSGEVTPQVEATVAVLSERRCATKAAQQFP